VPDYSPEPRCVGSDIVTLYGDRTTENGLSTIKYDDDGVLLCRFLVDVPFQRIPYVWLAPGPRDTTLDRLISGMDDEILNEQSPLHPKPNRNLYNRGVQRLWAALLLSVTGFLPVAGALSNTAHAPELAACCRAHGKHKCAMRLLQNAPEASPLEAAIYPVCDQYSSIPLVSLAAANGLAFPLRDSEGFDLATLSYSAAQLESEARVSDCFERSHWKRGPPGFLS
jgi:hypothetical protein